MLHVRDLCFSFGAQEILKNISLDLNKGEIFAITGPNGSGKTTLLKCIVGILAPSSGTVQINKNISFSFLSQERPEGNQLVEEFLISKFPKILELYKRMQHTDPESMNYARVINEYMEAGG